MDIGARRVIDPALGWEELRARFRWQVPERFNMAAAVCDAWAEADPGRLAIIDLGREGAAAERREISFGAFRERADRLANALAALGVGRGDRVGVLLAQSAEVLISHVAIWKLGAISLPLFIPFGPDALAWRLGDSAARALITDRASLPKVAAIRDRLPALEHVIAVDGPEAGALGLEELLARAAPRRETAPTAAEDPAMIIYTSGTTGPPKGALHAHRFLLGHLPAVELQHEHFPQPGDRMWTPADWAWIGGLMNIAVSALWYGVPVIARRFARFDPEAAFALIREEGARNLFLPPTALKLMRQAAVPRGLAIRSIMSGGESLGADMLAWGREALGVAINETYGQTECNLVLTSCAGLGVQKPGWIGKAVPGHEVAIIDAEGRELPPGELGEIAVRRPDPVMFLGYWNNPAKTAAKFTGPWMRTGDLGRRDEEGYFAFESRDDDVITSAGYRIGPTEIENCLTGHAAVAMAAAVGVPDPVRTEVIWAYVVPAAGVRWSEALEAELIGRVRERVSPHVAPRRVIPIEAMPLTATGKIMRRELRARAEAERGGGGAAG
ncbi:MAG: AMP-dependent synthetase [Alphaproteobacteria bacterium]|nr:MAG: AMP-dependent synthetase [Alphaproteobacteria bacterium]